MLYSGRTSVSTVTPPATEPVTLADAKAYLRVSGTGEDFILTTMIQAARELCESYLGRKLITQTLKLTLDWFPRSGQEKWWDGVQEGAITDLHSSVDRLYLPFPPLQSVTSVVTYNLANTPATMDAAKYQVNTAGEFIALNIGEIWPVDLRASGAVEVTYVAGYGATAANMPATLYQALLLTINNLYMNRDCGGNLSQAAASMLEPYRVKDSLLFKAG